MALDGVDGHLDGASVPFWKPTAERPEAPAVYLGFGVRAPMAPLKPHQIRHALRADRVAEGTRGGVGSPSVVERSSKEPQDRQAQASRR